MGKAKEFGLVVNEQKMKYMKMNEDSLKDLTIDAREVKKYTLDTEKQFKYMCVTLTDSAEKNKEIAKRIAKGHDHQA